MLRNLKDISPSLSPLIVKADISSIQVDVIVYSTGCFVDTPGNMYKSLSLRYYGKDGKDLLEFLQKRFEIGKKKADSPDEFEKMGGLPQGFSAFIPSKDIPGVAPQTPALVLAVTGGERKGHVTPNSIELLVDNIFSTLNDVYPESGPNKLIAFPTFGLGTGGARNDRLPHLAAQIKAMQRGHQEYPHLVPVLIAYSDIIHRLALAARSKIFSDLQESIFVGNGERLLPQLQQELINNRLVIFVGAGVSQSSGLPNWEELVKRLAGEAQISFPEASYKSDELLRVAEKAKNSLGAGFGKALAKALGLTENFKPLPSITHYLLASLPTQTFVTTNFDNLLEEALRRAKRVAFAIHGPKDVAKAPTGELTTQVLKIHGDVTVPEDVVLTQEDYQHYFQKRPAVSALLKGLLLNRTFLFVGYSLRDPDLKVILDEVSSLLEEARRTAYAVVFDATPEEISYWQKRKLHLLCLEGDEAQEKTLFLWKFLDLLQVSACSPQMAWMAEDAAELLPADRRDKLNTLITALRKTICDFAEELENEDFPNDLMDFLFPWLILSSQQGMKIAPTMWKQIAKHYESRTPFTEATLLLALTAASFAFSSSEGWSEEMFEDKLRALEKKLF